MPIPMPRLDEPIYLGTNWKVHLKNLKKADGTTFDPTAASAIEFMLKKNITDSDAAALITKTLAAAQITRTSTTITVKGEPADGASLKGWYVADVVVVVAGEREHAMKPHLVYLHPPVNQP